MAREADKHPKDFKITNESGLQIRTESFLEIEPQAQLIKCVMESAEYGHGRKLTLEFERHDGEVMKEPYRNCIEFLRLQPAREVIDNLRHLADRLEEACVKALQPKSTD